MRLSRAAQSVGRSATLRLNAEAQALRERGEPVIHLGGGEPVSLAPASAIDAADKLIRTAAVRYTPAEGIAALRAAIARYTEEHSERPTDPSHVIASSGAKQAIQICLQAILDPGDEVVYASPYWVSYPEMARIAGGTPIAVTPRDGGLIPSDADLIDRFGPRTRAVLLNSPNNPSGLCVPDDVVAAVVQACEQRGIWLIADDIYHRLLFDGRKPRGCFRFAHARGEDSRIVLVNGVSKQYAMTGFRVGWAVAARPLIEAMTNLQSHETSGPSTIGQVAAAAALSGPQDAVETLRADLEQNRNALIERLRTLARIQLTPPHGTFYCFADFSAYDSDSMRLAAFLLEKARVITVPGIEFGAEGYLRLSFCGSRQDMLAGIDRIRWALDADAPREITFGGKTHLRDW